MLVPRAKILKPVHPSAGNSAWYAAQLQKLIDEMNDSTLYWLKSSYRNNEPLLAQDELPAAALRKAILKLSKRWQYKFDKLAPQLARFFARKAEQRSSTRLAQLLREAGLSVKFTMTRGMQDIMHATITEQVGLIRSIPQKYFGSIEVMVMESVKAGRDLKSLSDRLRSEYGVTKRRAQLIAKDQNNKATASMTAARHVELGITQAIWMHSRGGKVPRPTHLANDGKLYDVKKGWYDPDAYGKGKGAWVRPGELINCRCVSSAVIPGF